MMAPDWASLGEPAELADVRQLVHEAPDKETVQAVVKDILSRVGDQMGELRNAIDDLLWDYYEPYRELTADEQKAWREAFEAELNGGYESAATASATPHIYSEGEGPLEGRCSRCGLLLTAAVHLTRPRTTTTV